VEIENTTDIIGEYMFNLFHEYNPSSKKEKKLVNLLNTASPCSNELEWMSFSSYYLWLLIDRFHFKITKIKSIMTFDASACFNSFVNSIMKKRIDAMMIKNDQKAQFYKIILNASYGYDGLNTEKYKVTNNIVKYKKQQQLVCRKEFVEASTLKDDDDNSVYLVKMKGKEFRCKTCIQEAFFTLDNSKTWFLIFLYNFLFKSIDKNKFHFNHCDTDSFYMSIAGSQDKNCHQGLDDIIVNKDFYNENKYKFIPNPDGDMYENKKLLGCSIEREGDVEISLCPKSYMTFDKDRYENYLKEKDEALKNKISFKEPKENGFTAKCKGFTVKDGNLTKEDYINVVEGKTPQLIKETTQIRNSFSDVCKSTIDKVALSSLNNKGIVCNNQSQTVLPFYNQRFV
jgi:hypothetical protein